MAIRRLLIEMFEMAYAKVDIPWEAVRRLGKIADDDPQLRALVARLEDEIPPF